jgi:CDP-diglyceride synthetase
VSTIDPLRFLHTLGARALLAFAVVLAIWGTYQYFRKAQVSPGFRSSYLIMGGLTAVQGLLGLAAFATGGRPTTLLHFVYGAFAVLFLPGAYFWARSGDRRREAVILAGAAWVVSIAFFRGIATG